MPPQTALHGETLQGLVDEIPVLVRHTVESLVEVTVTVALAGAFLRWVPAVERWVVRRASVHGADRASDDATASAVEHHQRVETLVRVTGSVTRGVVISVAAVTVLSALGINVGPLVAGAGIAGVAVGFGAQSIVKDFFAGFFILFENQYCVGDTVTVGGVTGVVELLTMRVTVVRDAEGAVHFVQNGNVGTVTNKTYGWLRTAVPVSAPVGVPAGDVRATLEAIAASATADPNVTGALLGSVEVDGPLELTGTAVSWRLHARTLPGRATAVRSAIITALQHALGSDTDLTTLQWNRVRKPAAETPATVTAPAPEA